MSEPCIFCRIIAGELPATFLHQDDRCVAFLDIQPINPGHLLVVPRAHAVGLAELDPDDAARLAQVARELAADLRTSGLACEGVNLFLADGEAAGQEVFHAHLHVIPRFAGDGFKLRFGPHYHQRPSREALEAAAQKIRDGRTGDS